MTAKTIVFDKLAYSIPNFALAVDLSVQQIRNHIEAGDIVPSYSGSKPIITREEGERWLKALPSEKKRRPAA